MVYLSNAFSLQMSGENECSTRRVTLDEVRKTVFSLVPGKYIDRESEKNGTDADLALTAQSCVGHSDIAAVMSEIIGENIPVNRISVSLKPGDTLVVGQYVGPRLPEGCKTLPAGAKIDWYAVTCHSAGTIGGLAQIRADLGNAAANMQWPRGEEMLRNVAEKYFPQYFRGDEE